MSIRTVSDLHDRRTEHNKHAHDVYRAILRDVFTTIEDKDNQGKRNTMYRVPFVVYGNSKYKVATAVYYVVRKLSEGGFIVFPHDNNLLYIDWSIIPNANNAERKPSRIALKSCLKR